MLHEEDREEGREREPEVQLASLVIIRRTSSKPEIIRRRSPAA
jgi:hypothetical protein